MNPYVVTASLILWAASCAGAAWLGWDYRDAKVAQETRTAVQEALDGARDDAAIDMQAAADAARRQALAEKTSRNAMERGIADATLKARPDCSRDDQSLQLLFDAVDAANDDSPPAAGGLPQAVR